MANKNIGVPSMLVPIKKISPLGKMILSDNKSLMWFGDGMFNECFQVYRGKIRLVPGENNTFGVETIGDRMQNYGWYLKQSYERDNSLWGSFSEELIMDRLRDRKGVDYEVHCDQTFATTSSYGHQRENAYILKGEGEKVIPAFEFGARRFLERVGDFNEKSISRLAEFAYEDFMTGKYSNQSRKIGQEADSVFF